MAISGSILSSRGALPRKGDVAILERGVVRLLRFTRNDKNTDVIARSFSDVAILERGVVGLLRFARNDK